MSCNGCRVLRKGCSEDCVLRPCLEWINSPESQANATLFLAKFYGRVGLINLINSAPLHLRPDTFKSLFYEACGRIIDPIYGSVGLMSSGNWPRCEAAVEAVLQGSPMMMQGQQFDIRHISRLDSSVADRRSRVRARQGCKRSRTSSESKVTTQFVINQGEEDAKFTITGWEDVGKEYYDEYHLKRTPSHDSIETVEPELVDQEMFFGVKMEPAECYGIELELTLGINPLLRRYMATVVDISDGED